MILYKNYKEIEISLILNQIIRVGVVIIQAINDFSDKYMVAINSESFKTPSLTPHTLPNSKILFSKSQFGTKILRIC